MKNIRPEGNVPLSVTGAVETFENWRIRNNLKMFPYYCLTFQVISKSKFLDIR
jgi:hypothetical protein